MQRAEQCQRLVVEIAISNEHDNNAPENESNTFLRRTSSLVRVCGQKRQMIVMVVKTSEEVKFQGQVVAFL